MKAAPLADAESLTLIKKFWGVKVKNSHRLFNH